MDFFLDTTDVNEVKALLDLGLVDGVTTNPSLIAASRRKFQDVIAELCEIVPGPVSAEVIATDYKTMVEEGKKLAKIAENVAVKVPLTFDGLKACYALSNDGIMVNVTLCFSAAQALLAAKAGATFISPFVGRLDDVGQEGMDLIHELREIFDNSPNLDTQILAASMRHPMHVVQAAKAGADIATIPPKVLYQMINHPLTDVGLATFLTDWKKAGQVIG
ncbi:MAG: fructose-6-phosphate aldolase [Alphaproteobacteria bacterium]|nr:fructose-6-phosphate aldolase [Alphaproteobacteria bacterium]